MKVKTESEVALLVTPWTAAYQAPLSMGFSRQEYWSGVPFPSPDFNSSHLLYPKRADNLFCLWGNLLIFKSSPEDPA